MGHQSIRGTIYIHTHSHTLGQFIVSGMFSDSRGNPGNPEEACTDIVRTRCETPQRQSSGSNLGAVMSVLLVSNVIEF